MPSPLLRPTGAEAAVPILIEVAARLDHEGVLAQTQPGVFEPVVHALPLPISSPVSFDFDGDGDLDLLMSSDEEIFVLINDP